MSDSLTPDQSAAHRFLAELRTRISTQPLPYQSGVEGRALESLWEVFGQARDAMKEYPGCEKFAAEVSRMLNTLERLMPKEMSLTELTFDTAEELVKRSDGTANDNSPTKSRALRVKLLGVAPSDVDLANFLAGLTNVPFFQEVSLTYARDKSQGGHTMREFEVAFGMSLNPPSE